MSSPHLIEETNLSIAWARAFLLALASPGDNPPPMTVSLTGFKENEPQEDVSIREMLDNQLVDTERNSIDVSALVVFPYKAWKRKGRPSCKDFSQWCLDKYAPRLKARDRRNKRGLYFERMMSVPGQDKHGNFYQHNQLAYIIDWWKETEVSGRRPRRSGLQVTCFEPAKDHDRSPRPGFPCLQQVGFNYDDTGLTINAFYPTQFIFDRGYGNYLGLCHLGAFVAHELGQQLVRMNCFVGRAELGITKADVAPLARFIRERVPTE